MKGKEVYSDASTSYKISMKINFCLPPGELSGGPLAIMEYANGFQKRGHQVTITTFPISFWPDKCKMLMNPFPWYAFKGETIFPNDSEYRKNIEKAKKILLNYCGEPTIKEQMGYGAEITNMAIVLSMIDVIPDCDINVATFWLTAFPVYFSRKGKPVYFMQHYEEVFERKDYCRMLRILSIRNTYELPMYKVANSSWLQKIIYKKFNQVVPFSLNSINVEDFSPMPKKSEKDGVIRLLSYCDEREWKGFADIACVVSKLYDEYKGGIEWHVFGKVHSRITPDNKYAPYIVHTGLPYNELARLYAESDIFISASWYESFPLPPLEAMASGTSVVTTTYGTEDYCFDNKNCLCVPPRAVDDIYKAVKRLIKDKALRDKLVKEGLKTSRSFSWEKAIDVREKMLLDIYNNEVDYNRFDPIDTGIVDGNGISFMKMPLDLQNKYSDDTYIKQGNRYFYMQNGYKRLIANDDIIAAIQNNNVEIKEVDEIECMRIPMGFTIFDHKDY